MAIRISDLPAAAGANAAMQFEVNNGGTSQRLTLAQMFALSTAVAADAPLLDFAQTWNNAAVAFTGLRLNITDTASNAGSKLVDWQVGGASKFAIEKSGNVNVFGDVLPDSANTRSLGNPTFKWAAVVTENFTCYNTVSCAIVSANTFGEIGSTRLYEDAANTLALRNGTSTQGLRIYKSFTDASNFTRLNLFHNGSEFQIQAQGAGTGGAPDLFLKSHGALYFSGGNGNAQWKISTAGHWLAQSDNTNDIGASGGNRPRNIYAAGSIYGAGFGGPFGATFNEALTGAGWAISGRLMFGGTTNAFPALKPNATTLEVKLADDSDYAPLACDHIKVPFDDGAPGTPGSGSPSAAYYGSDGGYWLAAPAAWMKVTINGTDYKVPCY